jgi:hypothetical protein
MMPLWRHQGKQQRSQDLGVVVVRYGVSFAGRRDHSLSMEKNSSSTLLLCAC